MLEMVVRLRFMYDRRPWLVEDIRYVDDHPKDDVLSNEIVKGEARKGVRKWPLNFCNCFNLKRQPLRCNHTPLHRYS